MYIFHIPNVLKRGDALSSLLLAFT